MLKIYNMLWSQRFLIVLTVATAILSSCGDKDDARIEVSLTDAPGDYEAVNIDIQDVQINRTDQVGGWESLEMENQGVFNLLELTNGLDRLLGTLYLGPGKISQIRLTLGANNTILVNGGTKPLVTPSAQQSGLKINIDQTLEEGVTYRILLDFDVAKSIVARGNGVYALKPVIRAIVESTSGSIDGSVVPKESNPAVYAIAGTDTVGTTFVDEDGHFLLRGISAGLYRVSLAPKTGYKTRNIDQVQVITGVVTNLGELMIEPE